VQEGPRQKAIVCRTVYCGHDGWIKNVDVEVDPIPVQETQRERLEHLGCDSRRPTGADGFGRHHEGQRVADFLEMLVVAPTTEMRGVFGSEVWSVSIDVGD
jgi:hypothetical protein